MRRKLITYSLNPSNEVGGDKARGFTTILGIEAANAEYLEGAIQTGVMVVAVSGVRDNLPYGLNCGSLCPFVASARRTSASSTRGRCGKLRATGHRRGS